MEIDENLLLESDSSTDNPIDYKNSVKRKKAEKLANETFSNLAKSSALRSVGPVTSVTNLAPIDSYWENGETLYDLNRGQSEYLAKQQGNLAKIGNTIGQGVGTFLTATASTLGTIGSSVAAIGAEAATLGEAEGMDIMLNNPVMKGISDIDKYIKEDLLPTYYTQEQQQSLLSAATATDGINGLGFLLSNIIPGAAVTKGLGGISRLATLAKAGKLEMALDGAISKGLMKAEEKAVTLAFGNTMAKLPAVTGAVVARLGESAMEANGTYEELVANGVSEEEAKKQRDNVFYGNMALAASDLAQFTRWFKPSAYDDIVKQGGKYIAKESSLLKKVGEGVSEGLQEAGEEGYQYLLQQGAKEDSTDSGNNFISDVIGSSNDLFTTVEGQKSMLLGAVLGSGAGAAFKQMNSKSVNEQLNSTVNNLNANPSIANDKFIKNEEGQYILNPEYIKQGTRFYELEKERKKAIDNGDLQKAELIDKFQFSNLVSSRIQANKFDDLIDELESLGKTTDSEIEQYFGQVPTDKNGNKLSANQIASNKIQEAKQIKKVVDNINLIPAYSGLSPDAKGHISRLLLHQDDIAKQIVAINNQISSIPYELVDTKEGVVTNEKPYSAPNQQLVDQLESQKEILKRDYDSLNNIVKEYTAKPIKIEQAIQKENEKVDKAFEEVIDKEVKTDNKVDAELKNFSILVKDTPQIITTPSGEKQVIFENGTFIDNYTGEEVPIGEIREYLKQGVKELEEAEVVDTEEEYFPGSVNPYESAKKPSIFSTSTRGHKINVVGKSKEKEEEFTNNPFNELKWAIDSIHYNLTKYISDFKNSPGINGNKYSVKLELGFIDALTLQDVNDRRVADGLQPLLKEDLDKPEYKPIIMKLYNKEKEVNVGGEIMHFHDIDYTWKTQQIDNLLNNAELSKEETQIAIDEILAKTLKERQNLISQLEKGIDISIPIVNKSTGRPNYNPSVAGKKQVLPIAEVFGELIGKNYQSGSNKFTSNGIGVIESIDEDNTTIRFENGNTAIYPNFAINGVLGQSVFETLSANGSSYLIDELTKREFSTDTLDSISTLIMYKFETGSNQIQQGKTKLELFGAKNNRGIVDGLINTGIRREGKEKQLFFKKDGTLVIGNKEFPQGTSGVKEILDNHLATYYTYPKFTLGTVRNKQKLILPTSIDTQGNAEGKLDTFENFLFKGEAPILGTNINTEIPFINAYYSFDSNNEGNLNIITSKKETVKLPYSEDLEGTISIGSLEDSGEIKIVETHLEEKQEECQNMTETTKIVGKGKKGLNKDRYK